MNSYIVGLGSILVFFSLTSCMTQQKIIVESGDSVEVHYVGTLIDGEQFDSSRDRGQPLPFTVGAGQMIAGFDSGVISMAVGDSKTLTLAPADAYGEKSEENMQVLPKKDLASFTAAGFELKVGEKLPTQFGEFEIISSDDESITIDTNHALAGETLIFEVEMMKITKAGE